jgi:hypothetical protein
MGRADARIGQLQHQVGNRCEPCLEIRDSLARQPLVQGSQQSQQSGNAALTLPGPTWIFTPTGSSRNHSPNADGSILGSKTGITFFPSPSASSISLRTQGEFMALTLRIAKKWAAFPMASMTAGFKRSPPVNRCEPVQTSIFNLIVIQSFERQLDRRNDGVVLSRVRNERKFAGQVRHYVTRECARTLTGP